MSKILKEINGFALIEQFDSLIEEFSAFVLDTETGQSIPVLHTDEEELVKTFVSDYGSAGPVRGDERHAIKEMNGWFALSDYQDLTLHDYQERIQEFVLDTVREDQMNYSLQLLMAEAGEVADVHHKALRRGEPVDDAKVADEVGDVLFSLALLLDHYNISLEVAAQLNLAKLSERKANNNIARIDGSDYH